MGKTRLIQAVLLAAVCLPLPQASPDDPADDEAHEWERFSERCASTSLKTLASDEADARANDRDGIVSDPPPPTLAELASTMKGFRGCDGGNDRVVDFWTADIAGLYSAVSWDTRYTMVVQFVREVASWAESFSW